MIMPCRQHLPLNPPARAVLKTHALQTLARGARGAVFREASGVRASLAPLSGRPNAE